MRALKDFCFAADERYTMPLRVCVASLIWSMRKNIVAIRIHVLDLGIDDATFHDMTSLWHVVLKRAGGKGDEIEIVRHPVNKALFGSFMPWNGSVATYARLLLPDLLKECKWCLYSDCDVLFVESPLHLSAFCQKREIAVLGHKNPPWCDRYDMSWFESQHLPFDSSLHFCAGVILMNLEHFRQNNLAQKCFDFLSHYQVTASADQTALNAVCAEARQLLPWRWGVFCGELDGTIEREEGGGAIHYADGVPWKAPLNCTMLLGRNPQVADIWRKFAVEIAAVPAKETKPAFLSLFQVRIRSVILQLVLMVAKVLPIKLGRYENWPGKNISSKTVECYLKWLFEDA